MNHLWKRIKRLLLALLFIFVISSIGASVFNQISFFSNFIAVIIMLLPLYFIFLAVTEIVYHHNKTKEHSINSHVTPETPSSTEVTTQHPSNKVYNSSQLNSEHFSHVMSEYSLDSEVSKRTINSSKKLIVLGLELTIIQMLFQRLLIKTAFLANLRYTGNAKI